MLRPWCASFITKKSYNRCDYRSLPTVTLHVVMLKRQLNLFMAENNSESVDVDPHSNTDTPGTVTGTCLPVAEHCSRARASVVLLRAMDNAPRTAFTVECHFFGVRILVTDLKPLAPPYRPSVAEVSSVLSRREKQFAQKNGKKQYL